MMDLRLLQTFMSVAAESSFRKAAGKLHCSPSTVTARIKALEDDLGAALFDRSGREASLTGQGLRLLQNAGRLLDLEARTRASLTEDQPSTLELCVRISHSLGIFCLPRILPGFRRSYSDLRITLATSSPHGLTNDLRRGVFDLACILAEPFSVKGLRVEALGRARIVPIISPASPLADRRRIGPEDLAETPLVLTPRIWSARRFVEQAMLDAHVGAGPIVECPSVEIVKRCVMAGLGLSFAPEFSVREEAASGRLIVLEWALGRLEAPVLLVRNERRGHSPEAEAFCAILQDFFRNDPAWKAMEYPAEPKISQNPTT
jgi:DNA-binding transcriptional LysR family regulator